MAPEATEQQTIEEITPQEAFAELDGGGVKLIPPERSLTEGRRVDPARSEPTGSKQPCPTRTSGSSRVPSGARSPVAALAGARLHEPRQHERRHPRMGGPGPAGRVERRPDPEQRDRYAAHPAARGSKASDQVARSEGAAARRRRSGAPTALYLAAAGIGTIGIVDDDVVDASNRSAR